MKGAKEAYEIRNPNLGVLGIFVKLTKCYQNSGVYMHTN